MRRFQVPQPQPEPEPNSVPPLKIHSAEEIMNKPRPLKAKWGDWIFDDRRLTLTCYGCYAHPDNGYEIDLEEIDCSAEMLDTIFQIRNKNWATPQRLKDLLDALHALLRPQANYCSFGQDTKVPSAEILKKRFSDQN